MFPPVCIKNSSFSPPPTDVASAIRCLLAGLRSAFAASSLENTVWMSTIQPKRSGPYQLYDMVQEEEFRMQQLGDHWNSRRSASISGIHLLASATSCFSRCRSSWCKAGRRCSFDPVL